MNFFDRPPINPQPNPEPQGYDYLRYLLMSQATNSMANPYGLSPQGMQNFGGFNQGNRPFNPYGNGAPTPLPSQGQPQGGGQGQGGMPPQIMQFLQMLMSHQQPQGGGMPHDQSPMVNRGTLPASNPRAQYAQGPQAAPPQMSRPMAPPPQQTMGQPTRNYDGNVVGYGGNKMGGAGFGHGQPQNVMALMRAFGQVPRPPHMGMRGR